MIEPISKLPRLFILGLFFPLIYLNIWLLLLLAQQLQPLTSILATSIAIAFLLDYPIRFLQEKGLKRIVAMVLVLLLFLVALITIGVILGPLILQQANELIIRLPEWIASGKQQLLILENWAIAHQLPIDASSSITQLVEKLSSMLRFLNSQLVGLLLTALGSIINVFLTLVFVIFLVLRGENLREGILSWLPAEWADYIRQSLIKNFEVYIVGQVILAGILGTALTTAFTLLGVPLALLFSSAIAVASLVPFGGSTSIVIVSLLLALQDFWLGAKVLGVALAIAQVNDNLLAPRIVGDLIGINPVWMLIALSIGVKVGGFIGLLLAVPMASFIKGIFDKIRASHSSQSVEPMMIQVTSKTQEI